MSNKETSPDYLPKEYLASTTDLYNTYQQRYAENPRESDKALIALIAEAIAPRLEAGEKVSLLDIGCSTGNLLFHLKKAFPTLELTGGDLAPGAIKQCQADPRLANVHFEVMDILDLPLGRFDVVVGNAVTYFFDPAQYESAIASIAQALKHNGYFLSFEFLHPFLQNLHIVEKSRSHPDGLDIYFRPYSEVEPLLNQHGFGKVAFHPFSIPIDLNKGTTYTDNKTGFEDLNSYTVKTESGQRLLFRGTLFQPWCHLMAQKTG